MGLFTKEKTSKNVTDIIKSSQPISDSSTKDVVTMRNWYTDRYEWMLIQRNLLLLILIVSIVVIVFLNFSISFIKSTKSIEPFVIEIEPKTGVPTVVQPLSAVAYTADESINRYFIWRYIKLHEEYYPNAESQTLREIRMFSNDLVYAQYRRSIDKDNLQSPVNLYGNATSRYIELKSLILQDNNTAQVRIRWVTEGALTSKSDKIVYIRFDYENLEMADDKRLINPLGFIVKSYRIEDERL